IPVASRITHRRFPRNGCSLTGQVRIVVVDDHAVVRAGLRLLLECEPDTTVVDEAATLADAVFKVRRHTPTMILLDVRLPDGDGVEAIGRLMAESPLCHVLVLSMEDDPHHVRRAFAKLLSISVRTAESHRAHIMSKLRLSSRAELVAYAMQNGMLRAPAP